MDERYEKKVYQRREFMNVKLLIGARSLTLESLAGQVAILTGAGKSSIMKVRGYDHD
jgi:hypothetical protein